MTLEERRRDELMVRFSQVEPAGSAMRTLMLKLGKVGYHVFGWVMAIVMGVAFLMWMYWLLWLNT